jgi:hypothetical protein
VILNHVADDAGLLEERTAAAHAKRLGHRDLNAAHVLAIPDGLEHRVREAKVDEVLYRLLAEEVVDSKDRRLGEGRVQLGIERHGRREIATKRLLDHDARVLVDPARPQLPHDDPKHARRNGHVVERALRPSEEARQLGEGAWIGVIPGDIAQERAELVEGRRIDPLGRPQAVPHALAQISVGPGRLGHADNRHRQSPRGDERLQRGKDLAVSEIAARAEEHEGIRRHVQGVSNPCARRLHDESAALTEPWRLELRLAAAGSLGRAKRLRRHDRLWQLRHLGRLGLGRLERAGSHVAIIRGARDR